MAVRKILVVIDMQNDFIDGSLGTKEAVGIVKKAAAEIRKYKPENIFATRDTHPADYLKTAEGKKLPVVHCVKGSKGWEINPEIARALKGAEITDKPTFGSVKLARKLKKISDQEKIDITVIGLCTDICVVSNALLFKAEMPEVPIHVMESCCAGVTPESHTAALSTMRMCQIDVR